jgi:hypothetical protein
MLCFPASHSHELIFVLFGEKKKIIDGENGCWDMDGLFHEADSLETKSFKSV